jgi:hypothetical protein
MQKPPIPRPDRESYLKHRRQFWLQILLPTLLTTLIVLLTAVLAGMATFGAKGDVARWSAIATIWLVIPLMIGMLVFLAIMAASVYGLSRLLKVAPEYTGIAQTYALWFNAQVVLHVNNFNAKLIQVLSWLRFFAKEEEENGQK